MELVNVKLKGFYVQIKLGIQQLYYPPLKNSEHTVLFTMRGTVHLCTFFLILQELP
jgi:hypothetical protein